MGLLRSLLTLPVSGPLKTALWVSDEIRTLAEREYSDPAFIRKELERLEERLLAGELTEDAFEEAELALLLRLKHAEAAKAARAQA